MISLRTLCLVLLVLCLLGAFSGAIAGVYLSGGAILIILILLIILFG